MNEQGYHHSPDPDMRFYDDAASAVGFYDKQQQQRLFSVADEPAPDQPLDFSTKRRHANGGCHRGAAVRSPPYGAAERKASNDSGIDGCVPSAIDFRLRKQPYPQQHSAPSPRTTPPTTLAASFADDLLTSSRTPSPRSLGAAAEADGVGGEGEPRRAAGAVKRAAVAASALAAAQGAVYPPMYSPFLSSPELQASTAAAVARGYGGVWPMALNPVAGALVHGEAKLTPPPPPSGPAAAAQLGGGKPAVDGSSAVARLAAKASYLRDVCLPPAANGYYAAALPAAAFTSPMSAASAADSPMTVQTIRNQSEELFHMYKLQLLDVQDKQKRAVRDATSRLCAARRRESAGARASKQRQATLAVSAAETGDKQQDSDSPTPTIGGGGAGSVALAGTLAASLKDACSSTCSRSSMSSDCGESQAGSTTSAAASPSCAPSGGSAGGGGTFAAGGFGGGEQLPEQSSATMTPSSSSARKRSRPVLNDEQKDGAYWERRRKNNEAAKRSRDARRAKEDEIAIRAAFLEQENLRLRVDIASLKQEADQLRCLLYSAT